MAFEKTTCVAKGIEKSKYEPPHVTFMSPNTVYRWGKATKDPTHRWDVNKQCFVPLRKKET